MTRNSDDTGHNALARPAMRHADLATRDPESKDRMVSASEHGRAKDGERLIRLLLVEDDRLLADALARGLELSGFTVYTTSFGEDALDLVNAYRFDLTLLDLTLPDMAGQQVLQALRKSRNPMPVIILSGEADVGVKVEQLIEGADDYITKPFHLDELKARIHALLRRTQAAAPTEINIGPVKVDLSTHRVLIGDELVPLTGKEYACFEFLATKRGMTLTKEMFLTHLYEGRKEPEMKIIDVFICKLRRKLADAGAPDVIETVWGRGYTIPAE